MDKKYSQFRSHFCLCFFGPIINCTNLLAYCAPDSSPYVDNNKSDSSFDTFENEES